MLNQQIPQLFTLISHNSNSLFTHCFRKDIKKAVTKFVTAWFLTWTSQGLNLGPPDYESVALTNWATSPMNRFIFDCDAKVAFIFYSANIWRKKMKLFSFVLPFCNGWITNYDIQKRIIRGLNQGKEKDFSPS